MSIVTSQCDQQVWGGDALPEREEHSSAEVQQPPVISAVRDSLTSPATMVDPAGTGIVPRLVLWHSRMARHRARPLWTVEQGAWTSGTKEGHDRRRQVHPTER